MKKGILLLLPTLLIAAVVVYLLQFQIGKTKPQEKRIFRVSIAIAADSHYHKGLIVMDQLLRERSEGMLSLEIHHSAELGSEREAVRNVAEGKLDMTLSTTAPLANLTPAFMVFDLPFIIQNKARAYAWMDGPEGLHIMDSLQPHNIVGLSFWESGFRHLTNNVRPIVNPEDVRGLKIRTMENPIHLATFRVLGAETKPMAFDKLYAALQQGLVQGQENPPIIIETSHLYEVQNHLALTGHFYAVGVLMVNKGVWDSLSTDQRMIMIQAAADARDWERKYSEDLDAEMLKTLKTKGMSVTSPDKRLWEKAVQPVYDEFASTLIDKRVIQSLRDAQK